MPAFTMSYGEAQVEWHVTPGDVRYVTIGEALEVRGGHFRKGEKSWSI